MPSPNTRATSVAVVFLSNFEYEAMFDVGISKADNNRSTSEISKRSPPQWPQGFSLDFNSHVAGSGIGYLCKVEIFLKSSYQATHELHKRDSIRWNCVKIGGTASHLYMGKGKAPFRMRSVQIGVLKSESQGGSDVTPDNGAFHVFRRRSRCSKHAIATYGISVLRATGVDVGWLGNDKRWGL